MQLPIDRDSVPVHLLTKEPIETAHSIAQILARQPDIWAMYGPWLATMFPVLWEEVRQMARKRGQGPVFNMEPLVEYMGMKELIRQLGIKKVIDEVGVKRVVDEVGVKRVVDEVGVDTFINQLSPEQRRQFKQRL